MNAISRTGLLLALLILTACAGIIQKPIDDKTAADQRFALELVQAIENRNKSLFYFKGTGRFKLCQENKVLSARAAWAGFYPKKLRIALLNPTGQPLVTLSADGQNLYVIFHSNNQFYKTSSANPNLSQLVSIPVTARDLISILTARFPIREFHRVELSVEQSKREYILELTRKWRGVTEKIFLDAGDRSVLRIEVFNGSNQLAYHADFKETLSINDYTIPKKIEIFDDDGNRFELEVDQCWTDIPLESSMFVLNPPG